MHHKKKKQTNRKECEIVFGAHAIIELLRAKRRKVYSIYTTKKLPKAWGRVKAYLPKRIDNIQYVSRDVLTKMAGSSDHMGIVAMASPFQYYGKVFNPKDKPFILLLDGIQDVRNLGAILRSAYCTGVDGVVLCKKGGADITPAACKTSAGLVEYLDIYRAASIESAVQELSAAGYNLYMTVLDNGKDAMTVNYEDPKCLVIGNEETGISKEVAKRGERITLPQRREDISYNASVAAGIFLFLLSQKLGK